MLTPPVEPNGRVWNPGDIAVLRWVRNTPADLVAPVRIVEHNPQRTVLFLAAGTPLKSRAVAGGHRQWRDRPFLERERMRTVLSDDTWTDNHTLMIHEPHRLGAVWLFWSETDWTFNEYYVNLQAPLEPSPVGFDTADYLLDIVVQPDLAWSWKDEDEFAEALEHELIPSVLLHAVRSEGRRFTREIEGRQWPFGKGLERWRPEPDWDVPTLPENWAQGLIRPN